MKHEISLLSKDFEIDAKFSPIYSAAVIINASMIDKPKADPNSAESVLAGSDRMKQTKYGYKFEKCYENGRIKADIEFWKNFAIRGSNYYQRQGSDWKRIGYRYEIEADMYKEIMGALKSGLNNDFLRVLQLAGKKVLKADIGGRPFEMVRKLAPVESIQLTHGLESTGGIEADGFIAGISPDFSRFEITAHEKKFEGPGKDKMQVKTITHLDQIQYIIKIISILQELREKPDMDKRIKAIEASKQAALEAQRNLSHRKSLQVISGTF